MKRLLSFLITVAVLLSCKESHNIENDFYQFDHPIDTIFKKEIPATGYSYKVDKYKEKQLGLESIESGFETLQIRLWVDPALYKGKELYVLKNINGKWSGEIYKIKTERNAENEDSIISKESKEAIPKCGWDSLWLNLSNLKIISLPNMHNIPGLVDMVDDGIDLNIEIASKYQYRYYGYHSPEYFQDKFWQARNMNQIVKLIREQFNP